MKSACALLVSSLLFAACTSAPAPEPAAPATTGPAAKPYANLNQMMRAVPFLASNVIFAAQNEDPAAKKGDTSGADRYSGIAEYAGWTGVENAALALSETANLLLVPGRKCSNGKDAPLDREDYRKAIQQLADAGQAAYKAAQSKNQDQIVEVSGTIAEACAACHDVYREKENPMDRCTPPAGK
jgi:Cytochrome C'